jgi:N-acetylmuramoyl-L-alanine amidase
VTELLLTPNPYSRPLAFLRDVKGLVVHWVANPGSSARATRAFFESRKDGKLGFGSAHYAIDPTEVVRMVPENEVAYHAGAWKYTDYALKKFGTYPNAHTIGIELHHIDWAGRFHEDTLAQLRVLLRDLCDRYGLVPETDICRHYDITEKLCPRWWVDHSDEFRAFLKTV